MIRSQINKWIKAHPLYLRSFDLNNNGILDEGEIESVYQTLVDYNSKRNTQKWFYGTGPGDIKGPVTFLILPNAPGLYARPEDSKVWVPIELLKLAANPDAFQERKEIFYDRVILSTTETVEGFEILEHKGLVWGITVRSKDFMTDWFSGIRNFFGGELKGYTQLAIDTRQEAIDRLITSARRLGANGVVKLVIDSGGAGYGSAEVTAYGTAVLLGKTGNNN